MCWYTNMEFSTRVAHLPVHGVQSKMHVCMRACMSMRKSGRALVPSCLPTRKHMCMHVQINNRTGVRTSRHTHKQTNKQLNNDTTNFIAKGINKQPNKNTPRHQKTPGTHACTRTDARYYICIAHTCAHLAQVMKSQLLKRRRAQTIG